MSGNIIDFINRQGMYYELFTTVGSATWTRPSGVDSIFVLGSGGGAGGGGGQGGNRNNSNFASGAGGAGCGPLLLNIYNVTDDLTVIIGAGGAGGTAGTANGGDAGNGSVGVESTVSGPTSISLTFPGSTGYGEGGSKSGSTIVSPAGGSDSVTPRGIFVGGGDSATGTNIAEVNSPTLSKNSTHNTGGANAGHVTSTYIAFGGSGGGAGRFSGGSGGVPNISSSPGGVGGSGIYGSGGGGGGNTYAYNFDEQVGGVGGPGGDGFVVIYWARN